MKLTIDLTPEQISELMRVRMVQKDPSLHLKFVNALMTVGPHYENPIYEHRVISSHGPRCIPKDWETDGRTLEQLINSRQAVKAIKCLRTHVPGLGLKEAKDIYDEIIRKEIANVTA